MTEVLTQLEQPQDQQEDTYDFDSPEIAGDFFIDPKVGTELYKVVETYGQITKRSAGYKQLYANDGRKYLVAMAYTATGYESQNEPKLFHAIISSLGEQSVTTAISIPLATGTPIVTRSEKSQAGGWATSHELEPSEAEKEIAGLVKLIAYGLPKDAQVPVESPQQPAV
jgi:hypothetical protein